MISSSQLRAAADGSAWKTASMRGYMFKSVAKGDGATGFWLAFIPAGVGAVSVASATGAVTAASGTITCFKFKADGTPEGWASGSPNEPNYDVKTDLDAELLGHLLTSTWQQSTQEECEAARVGVTGGKW